MDKVWMLRNGMYVRWKDREWVSVSFGMQKKEKMYMLIEEICDKQIH